MSQGGVTQQWGGGPWGADVAYAAPTLPQVIDSSLHWDLQFCNTPVFSTCALMFSPITILKWSLSRLVVRAKHFIHLHMVLCCLVSNSAEYFTEATLSSASQRVVNSELWHLVTFVTMHNQCSTKLRWEIILERSQDFIVLSCVPVETNDIEAFPQFSLTEHY